MHTRHANLSPSYGRLLWDAWNVYLKRASAYQSALLLNMVYVLVLGPSAAIARLSGTRLLDLSRGERASYWVVRHPQPKTLKELGRQF